MRIQGLFTAAKLLALVAVVIAGVVHIAGGENILHNCKISLIRTVWLKGLYGVDNNSY
jgi:hypothetical protein